MFIGKRLKKMVLPGLTFGEHCVNLSTSQKGRNICFGLGR